MQKVACLSCVKKTEKSGGFYGRVSGSRQLSDG